MLWSLFTLFLVSLTFVVLNFGMKDNTSIDFKFNML